MKAAASGDVSALRRLLSSGASPNASDSDGDGPLVRLCVHDEGAGVAAGMDVALGRESQEGVEKVGQRQKA